MILSGYEEELMFTLCILIVSEVAMEGSPGPSTSSASRPEADHRAQSSAANMPRAGTQSKHTDSFNDFATVELNRYY